MRILTVYIYLNDVDSFSLLFVINFDVSFEFLYCCVLQVWNANHLSNIDTYYINILHFIVLLCFFC